MSSADDFELLEAQSITYSRKMDCHSCKGTVESDEHENANISYGTEEESAYALLEIIDISKMITESDNQLFSPKVQRTAKEKQRRLANRITDTVRTHLYRLKEAFPNHRFNPYVTLLENWFSEGTSAQRAAHEWQSLVRRGPPAELESAAETLNHTIDKIRSEANSRNFKLALSTFSRPARKNRLALRSYIEALFVTHSRLVAIRLDLSYAKPPLWPADTNQGVSIDLVKKHWLALHRAFHKDLADIHLEGFAYKIEYGKTKGFHIHTLLFLNGTKVREDVSIAKRIGEFWKTKITNNRGLYFNCNAVKNKYKSCGIGQIDWYNREKREHLLMAADYLTKADLYLALFIEGRRAFGKGIYPAPRSRSGRPRNLMKAHTV